MLPPSIWPRQDIDRPEVAVVDVFQGHRHHARLAVDINTAEELQAGAGREVLALLRAAALLVNRGWPKRVVELSRSPAAGMKRARDELPERLEIRKDRAVRIVMMRRRIVHVRGEPDGVAHTGVLEERQQIGDFMLPARWRPVA